MRQNIGFYWANKKGRAELAAAHTKEMATKFSKEISDCISKTQLYDVNFSLSDIETKDSMSVIIDSMTTTDALFSYQEGKTAVLNFASFKEPGGGFIAGSRAQEECLCHDSFLYNVLKTKQDYYAWNNQNKNLAMYKNRALYSPNVTFINPKDNSEVICDVITCAAPNYSAGFKYGNVSKEENSKYLDSRIKFVLDIAADQKIDTLILGAFGCGVFKQNPKEVAEIFIKYLKTTHKCFKKVIFAIPADVNSTNYSAFYETLNS